MQDLATEFPMDRELLFYVADMFPADAVYPGRPYGDMTLRFLVFDCHRHGQKCLGVLNANIVLCPYHTKENHLVRHPDVGIEANFITKWDSFEPIEILGDEINPWCLWDRSFLANLAVANFATMRQVPDIETMRLHEKKLGQRKIKMARLNHKVLRGDNRVLAKKLACLRKPKVDVYWGDFEVLRSVKNWQLADALMKAPSLLLDTVNGQASLCYSGRCEVRPLKEVLKQNKNQGRFDFYGRNKFILCLIALALNSKYKIPTDQTTLFIKSDYTISEPKSGAVAYRHRIKNLREWLSPEPDEFILKPSTVPEGPRTGSLNPKCKFFVIADPQIESIAKQENTFETWRRNRKLLTPQ